MKSFITAIFIVILSLLLLVLWFVINLFKYTHDVYFRTAKYGDVDTNEKISERWRTQREKILPLHYCS